MSKRPRDRNVSDKLQDHLAYPPRAMRADRAAAYLDMSTTKFLQLVEDGRMPKPIRIDGMVAWDRLELDAALDNLKDDPDGGGPSPRRNTVDEAIRQFRERERSRAKAKPFANKS